MNPPSALDYWRGRLDDLLIAEAKTTDALALIPIRHAIAEAREKIAELENSSSGGARSGGRGGPEFDISRILRYAPAELIGRKAELDSLDAAWVKAQAGENGRPRVMTFVALGGEGKTSLVAKWATELAAKAWPGCEAAFAWSFYTQGTREQLAASSDLFFAEALEFFGVASEEKESGYEKGRRLARALSDKRALLILDGLEPLQYAPTSPTPGELKDDGVPALLQGLAQNGKGLCLVTTRYSIPDLKAFWSTTAPESTLTRLAKDAGVALLRTLGVRGLQKEFETLVEDVKGHALTLTLIGTYLRDAHGGDIQRRDLFKLEEADAEEQHGQAFHVMEKYGRQLESEGEKGERALALLRLLGLFDWPADAGCLKALWAAPAIENLTEPLVSLSEAQRNLALKRLEDAKLLTINRDATGLVSVDAHPLLREYFAARLQKERPEAWRAAHKRLYEYLCATPDKEAPTLPDLQPLYQAVAHGCQAGLQQEACDKVYFERILRGVEAYSTKKLGAIGADLGAVACFFDKPWSVLSPALAPNDQAWLLNEAAFSLRALGRLGETVELMQAALEIVVARQNWRNAATAAGNLSELRLTLGEIAAAITVAEESVAYAERSGDMFWQMVTRTTHADALAQAGQRGEAQALFREATALQAERQPQYPLLYSWQGFRYYDLLLAGAERAAWRRLAAPGAAPDSEARKACDAVSQRARRTLEWVTPQNWILDIALDHLTLGRATLYAALLAEEAPGDVAACRAPLREAVDGLRHAGTQDQLPRGLLTRALLRRLDGDPAGAREDLDEVFAIAKRGPMPLHLADVHLHRARLFGLGAQRVEPYPWDSARADLTEARRLIEKHGYWRRKEELQDAEAALQAMTGN
jgi:hypothetical protein